MFMIIFVQKFAIESDIFWLSVRRHKLVDIDPKPYLIVQTAEKLATCGRGSVGSFIQSYSSASVWYAYNISDIDYDTHFVYIRQHFVSKWYKQMIRYDEYISIIEGTVGKKVSKYSDVIWNDQLHITVLFVFNFTSNTTKLKLSLT